jgi:hypothetical protein
MNIGSYSVPSIVTSVKRNEDWTGDAAGTEKQYIYRGYGGNALKISTLSAVSAFIWLIYNNFYF